MRMRTLSVFDIVVVFALMVAMASIFLFSALSPAQAQPGRSGVSQTVRGVTVTLDELRRREAMPRAVKPRQASPRRTFKGTAGHAPNVSISATNPSSTASGQSSGRPDLPQALIDELLGPEVTDTPGFVPPDTMGAVGSIDFLFSANGRFRGFTKATPHTQEIGRASCR